MHVPGEKQGKRYALRHWSQTCLVTPPNAPSSCRLLPALQACLTPRLPGSHLFTLLLPAARSPPRRFASHLGCPPTPTSPCRLLPAPQAYLAIVAGFILVYMDQWHEVWIVSWVVVAGILALAAGWTVLPRRFTLSVELWLGQYVDRPLGRFLWLAIDRPVSAVWHAGSRHRRSQALAGRQAARGQPGQQD